MIFIRQQISGFWISALIRDDATSAARRPFRGVGNKRSVRPRAVEMCGGWNVDGEWL